MSKKLSFQDIKPFFSWGSYEVDVDWNYLKNWISSFENYGQKVDINPDFQRGHVWNEEQQIKFVEYKLRRGRSSGTLLWNCVDWNGANKAPIQLVDGKQRITAVLRFIDNEIPAFGQLYNEFTGVLRMTGATRFRMHVNQLETREEVLEWYLQLNDGGVVHTKEEIDRVRKLLDNEKHSKAI